MGLQDEIARHLIEGNFGSIDSINYDLDILYTGIEQLVDPTDLLVNYKTSNPHARILRRAYLDELVALNANKGTQKAPEINYLSAPKSKLAAKSDAELLISPLRDWESVSGNTISGRLSTAMARDGYQGSIEFIEPDVADIEQLVKSLNILEKYFSELARNTLPLVAGFAIVESNFTSAYNSNVPQAFMINKNLLLDPIVLGDTLIHESLHQKMSDIRSTHFLFKPEYDDIKSEENGHVVLPWGSSIPRKFSVARALATYHYYVHSAFYYSVIFQNSNDFINQTKVATTAKAKCLTALKRAIFIELGLEQSQCTGELAVDGIKFLNWLKGVLVCILNSLEFGDDRHIR